MNKNKTNKQNDNNKKITPSKEVLHSNFKTRNYTLNTLTNLKIFYIIATILLSVYYLYKLFYIHTTDFDISSNSNSIDYGIKSFLNSYISSTTKIYIINIITTVISCFIFCSIFSCIEDNARYLININNAVFKNESDDEVIDNEESNSTNIKTQTKDTE